MVFFQSVEVEGDGLLAEEFGPVDYVFDVVMFEEVFAGEEGGLHVGEDGLCVVEELVGEIPDPGVGHDGGGAEGGFALEELDFGVGDLFVHG